MVPSRGDLVLRAQSAAAADRDDARQRRADFPADDHRQRRNSAGRVVQEQENLRGAPAPAGGGTDRRRVDALGIRAASAYPRQSPLTPLVELLAAIVRDEDMAVH